MFKICSQCVKKVVFGLLIVILAWWASPIAQYLLTLLGVLVIVVGLLCSFKRGKPAMMKQPSFAEPTFKKTKVKTKKKAKKRNTGKAKRR